MQLVEQHLSSSATQDTDMRDLVVVDDNMHYRYRHAYKARCLESLHNYVFLLVDS